jgi:hypothetical protein
MADEATSATLATRSSTLPARALGAVLGATLAAGLSALITAIGLAGSVTAPASIALILGPDGIFSPTTGAPGAWALLPAAAAIAGFALGPSAVDAVRWSGTTMGFLTYLVGVPLGATLLLGPILDSSGVGFEELGVGGLAGMAGGFVILLILGAVVLAPLLALAMAMGALWARLVRATAPLAHIASDAAASSRSLPILLLVIVGVLIAGGWLVLTTFLDILAEADPNSFD